MSAVTCAWVAPCGRPGEHPVWAETRPGLIVHLDVCAQHLPDAVGQRYRTDAPPIPAPPHGA